MFLLLLKKAFFDAWDNLGALLLSNLAVMGVMMGGLRPMFRILESRRIEAFIILPVLVLLLFVAVGTVSALMSILADYRRAAWSEVPGALKSTWKHSLALGIIVTVFFGLSVLGITYYTAVNSFLALAASALLFWVTLAAYLSMLWFFAVRNRLSGGFRRLLKKCFLIMLDNLGISMFSGLILVPLQMLLWPLTAFGAFGPAGIQLYMNGALRLLMFKYDWLEGHPEAGRRDVPWYELLIDERERVGKRTLKGMIFPWKE